MRTFPGITPFPAAAALIGLLLSAAPAPAADDAQQQTAKAGALETVKRAINSQGDISPQAKAALSKTEAGKKLVEGADTRQGAGAPAQQTPARKGQPASGRKALYGDIIIHR
jgi:hypothetical protein